MRRWSPRTNNATGTNIPVGYPVEIFPMGANNPSLRTPSLPWQGTGATTQGLSAAYVSRYNIVLANFRLIRLGLPSSSLSTACQDLIHMHKSSPRSLFPRRSPLTMLSIDSTAVPMSISLPRRSQCLVSYPLVLVQRHINSCSMLRYYL